MSNFDRQLEKIKSQDGFIAALNQCGGSPLRALKPYRIAQDAYANGYKMFYALRQVRTRIITIPVFTGTRLLGTAPFRNTMDGDIEGPTTAGYLWGAKNVLLFLKVDKGLAPEKNGMQITKRMLDLPVVQKEAESKGGFCTKKRSVSNNANKAGVFTGVQQQTEAAQRIVAAGLVPVSELEIDINSPGKAAAEVF